MVGRSGDLESTEKAGAEGSVKCKKDSKIIRPEVYTVDVAIWRSFCASSDSNSSRLEEGKMPNCTSQGMRTNE